MMGKYLDLSDVSAGHPVAEKELSDLRVELTAMRERAEKYEVALKLISSIANRYNCGDWDEIEEAREIANKALLKD